MADDERGIDLQSLRRDLEKALALIDSPQPGLLTWNQTLRDTLLRIQDALRCLTPP